MASFNTRFYRAQDDAQYSDGSIEDEIYNRVCRNDPTLEQDADWTVFYHFSKLRQNILNWYPFSKGCSVLEIGGGCGALTGVLYRNAGHVTSCELTLRRAKILYERHKDAENLEVCVGNFLGMSFDRKFDYVVINGVLEYARGIMGEGCDDPFRAFLEHAKGCLNPGGIILLAIENRLGLKYLAGAPEDHTGRIFDGINGYANESYVKTFSKQELIDLCDAAQLPIRHWYYPYPDYKFPTEIFTDDSINKIPPSAKDIPFDMIRAELFNKEEVYHTLMRDGIAGNFSNSFLVELGGAKQGKTPTYVKISNNRSMQFSLCTLLYDHEGYAEKKALFPQGYQHLAQMEKRNMSLGLFRMQPVQFREGTLRADMIPQKSMRNVLQACVSSGNQNDMWKILEEIRDSFYCGILKKSDEDREFERVFGSEKIQRQLHWLPKLNIDLNVDNLFREEEHWVVIDNEWVFDFEIPAEFALWRMLYQLREREPFTSAFSDEDIRHFLDVGEADVQTFQVWERHFAKQYVGIEDLSVHWKDSYPIDMDVVWELYKKHISANLLSHLFLFKEGLDVEVLECQAINENGIWKARFRSDNIAEASAIRWDPLEGSACKISEINSGVLTVQAVNAEATDNGYVFGTFDPQFYLCGNWSELSEIEISFRCELLDWTLGYQKLEIERNQLISEKDQLILERNQLISEKDQMILERNQLISEKDQMISELEKMKRKQIGYYISPNNLKKIVKKITGK